MGTILLSGRRYDEYEHEDSFWGDQQKQLPGQRTRQRKGMRTNEETRNQMKTHEKNIENKDKQTLTADFLTCKIEAKLSVGW